MLNYLPASFNHFRALQAWAKNNDAKLELDVRTFHLEIKFRGRYYTFFPMFQGRVQGQIMHCEGLPDDVIGFGGWRPYRPFQHPLSTEKLEFKKFLDALGLRSPKSAPLQGDYVTPNFPCILKSSTGSFGKQIVGPFLPESAVAEQTLGNLRGRGEIYAEQFVEGKIVRVWFWGALPFFAHRHEYPFVMADGHSSVDHLLQARFKQVNGSWENHEDRKLIVDCLRFQQLELESVPAAGTRFWIDFRYSQHHAGRHPATSISDNALDELLSVSAQQIHDIGAAVSNVLKLAFAPPVMVVLDGVLDDKNQIWWLEMNSNSLVPPEAYAVMLDQLFSY